MYKKDSQVNAELVKETANYILKLKYMISKLIQNETENDFQFELNASKWTDPPTQLLLYSSSRTESIILSIDQSLVYPNFIYFDDFFDLITFINNFRINLEPYSDQIENLKKNFRKVIITPQNLSIEVSINSDFYELVFWLLLIEKWEEFSILKKQLSNINIVNQVPNNFLFDNCRINLGDFVESFQIGFNFENYLQELKSVFNKAGYTIQTLMHPKTQYHFQVNAYNDIENKSCQIILYHKYFDKRISSFESYFALTLSITESIQLSFKIMLIPNIDSEILAYQFLQIDPYHVVTALDSNQTVQFLYKYKLNKLIEKLGKNLDYISFFGENGSISIGIVNTIHNLETALKMLDQMAQVMKQIQKVTGGEVTKQLDTICPFCHNQLKYLGEFCSICGKVLPKCVICWGAEKPGELLVQFTCCLRYAHKNHIDNWRTTHDKCPACFTPNFEYQLVSY